MANQGSSFVAKLQEKLEYPCVEALNLYLVRDLGRFSGPGLVSWELVRDFAGFSEPGLVSWEVVRDLTGFSGPGCGCGRWFWFWWVFLLPEFLFADGGDEFLEVEGFEVGYVLEGAGAEGG